ncbi:MAG: hypothetical protein WD052_04905 [Bacteroidales bacterium]
MKMILNRFKIRFWITALSFLAVTCESGGYRIPYVKVDLHLNIISELGNPALHSHTPTDGGVNGLIVYREDYDLFHVYDRTCTLYPEHNKAVEPDTVFDGVYTCPECSSQFLISFDEAQPIGGPAVYSLHKYYSTVDGDLLHVYNY